MKIGIFVGSFNPPTKAHFDISHYLYKEKIVDKIIYVPVNNKNKQLINLDKRIDMLNSCINEYSYLEVSEIMKDYNHFDYKVLVEFHKKYKNIYIIMGSDLLERLSSFSNYHEMLTNYHFIIIPRFNVNCLELIKKEYNNYKDKFIITSYSSNISSTLVKERIRNKKEISELVPKEIEKYIIKETLYQ